MPLPTSSLINWLLSLGWSAAEETGAPIVPGPYVPEMPDRLVVCTATPGPGYLLEGDADAGGFQLRVRGPQDGTAAASAAAETLAYSLDALIKHARFPAVAGARTLIHVHRLGGPPSFLTGTADDSGRFELTASYVAIAGDS